MLVAPRPVGPSTARQHEGEVEAKGVALKHFHRGQTWFPSYLHTYPQTRIWRVVQDEPYYMPSSRILSFLFYLVPLKKSHPGPLRLFQKLANECQPVVF